jgi:hypothetical protein
MAKRIPDFIIRELREYFEKEKIEWVPDYLSREDLKMLIRNCDKALKRVDKAVYLLAQARPIIGGIIDIMGDDYFLLEESGRKSKLLNDEAFKAVEKLSYRLHDVMEEAIILLSNLPED